MTIPEFSPGPGKAVCLRRVTKSYLSKLGTVRALAEIDLAVEAGLFVSIVGPSGCGKSTLLKLVAGLEQASHGEVLVDGKPLEGPPEGLGVVFQRDVLLDWRNILDNVLLSIDLMGRSTSLHRDRATALLTRFGLAGFERRYPWELSGGMRQRVSICRALLTDPQLLLMDEPFGALDAMTRDDLNLELARIWQETRKTLLFITHSIPEAVFLSDRVILMCQSPGRIVEAIEARDAEAARRACSDHVEAAARVALRVLRAFEGRRDATGDTRGS